MSSCPASRRLSWAAPPWRALAVFIALAGCATPQRIDPGTGLVVADGASHARAFAGPATFTVRAVSAGVAQRVVGVPGVGEIHVGLGGDEEACRLVWSRGGLDKLVLYTARGCATRSDGRLCFEDAAFVRPTDAPDAGAPASLVVAGCADENDLLWSKVDGAQPATVGPGAFRQRCARIPREHGCALTYLRKDAVSVESNPAPGEGFAFLWDGEGWRACFLEKETGAYRVVIDVEDACGHARPVELAGTSTDLDD